MISSRFNRALSGLLILIFVLIDFIPFARAIKTDEVIKPISYFQWKSQKTTGINKLEKSLKKDNHSSESKKGLVYSKNAMNTVSSGSGQTETSGFSLNSTDDLVNKFTGDFNNSIPIMNVEGYPITLNYNSNIGMNSEASWVGLGWDLSVGGISREMRGVPDEFNGKDEITRTYKQKDNQTLDLNDPTVSGEGYKLGGFIAASYSFGLKNLKDIGFKPTLNLTSLNGKYRDSYVGVGTTRDMGLQAKLSMFQSAIDKDDILSQNGLGAGLNFSFGYTNDSKRGIGTNVGLGLGVGWAKNDLGSELSMTYGASKHSRKGMLYKSLEMGIEGTNEFSKMGKTVGFSYSGVSTVSYHTITSVPKVTIPSYTFSEQDLESFFLGSKIVNFTIRFGSINQKYKSKTTIGNNGVATVIQEAFGYLHSGKVQSHLATNKFPVMDFQRSEAQYSEEMKHLPFSVQSFDLFHVNALGFGGTFRANRTDFGTYYDPEVTSQTNSNNSNILDFDIESFSAGLISSASGLFLVSAIGLGDQTGNTQSSVWDLASTLNFENQNLSPENSFDPTVYFKGVGEITPNDMDAWDMMGGSNGDFFDVNKVGKEIDLTADLKEYGQNVTSTSLNLANEKPIRANCFNALIADDIKNSTNFAVFKYNTLGSISSKTAISRVNSFRKENHISAIEVVDKDGTKFSYAIPAYSLSNTEVSFASGKKDILTNNQPLNWNSTTGLVEYVAGYDNSIQNVRGFSNMYDKTVMPAFAHSYLLTHITGTDYVDRTQNGPSLDDIGNFYKFNYYQAYDAVNPYQSRFPISGMPGSAPKAMGNRGHLTSEFDDVASYNYNEKEIWYTHSVESKNQIALFLLEDRKDAYGVIDENGHLNTDMPLKLLKKIVLYNLSDFNTNSTNAVPLQTVEFIYDYSLCRNNPSNSDTYISQYNSSGKLTLKEIRSFNGKSLENSLYVQKFEYSAENPDFSYINSDAWGNYKPSINGLENDLFPYPEQNNETLLNDRASAWKLIKVLNAMGGEIEVVYESDRYKHVQNKRTMRHFGTYGLMSYEDLETIQSSNTWNGSDSKVDEFLTGNQSNNVLIFELGKPYTGIIQSVANQNVKKEYFETQDNIDPLLRQLYLKTMIEVKPGKFEFIPVIANIKTTGSLGLPFTNSYGAMPPDINGEYKYGYVVLQSVNTNYIESPSKKELNSALNLNPIQRFALDYIRQNLPELVYGTCVSCVPDPSLPFDKSVFSNELYAKLIAIGSFALKMDPNRSFVRLFENDEIKFGGGARVKRIIYRDNWNLLSNEYNSNYQWDYFYAERGREEGVASYESMLMTDENPFYTWTSYVDFNKNFPDESKFHVTPLTALLYPSPIIGYSEVQVMFSDGNSKGYSSTQFHSAKEYPTISRYTQIEKSRFVTKLNPLQSFGAKSKAYFGLSQGYYVETNDMHGRIKQEVLFDKFNNKLSRTTYNYSLQNTKPMLNRNGILTNESVALEYDIHTDSRLVFDESKVSVFGLNIILKLISFPIILPGFTKQSRNTAFYSNCLVKHMNRSAVLNSVETEYLGSINSAENLIYDYHSGNVIVSSLKDEFNDKLYNMNYPSHWYYPNLCELCSNSAISPIGTFTNNDFVIQMPLNTDLNDYFSSGDLVRITNGSTSYLVYILSLNETNASLIHEYGNPVVLNGGTWTMELKRSNRNNRLNETMQSTTTKSSISTSPGTFVFPKNEIISSSVITYRNKLNVRCGRPGTKEYPSNEVAVESIINPFDFGVVGDLVLDNQFAYQDERQQNTDSHGIRFDGTYLSSNLLSNTFTPFYAIDPASNNWYKLVESNHPDYISPSNYQRWRDLGKVKMFDEYGKAIEGENQIEIPSAILYGYNSNLSLVPIAQAVNSKQQSIAFDGFEDYTYHSNSSLPSIAESHFDFKSALSTNVVLVDDVRHSGVHSLRIDAGAAASTIKDIANPCRIREKFIDSFYVDPCICIPSFEPIIGEYIIGGWIKQTGDQGKIRVTFSNSSTSIYFDFFPDSKTIDGWQRVEGVFEIPLGYSNIQVSLINDNKSSMFVDDIRIHPFLAGMSTVVYDPKTLLPMASHDGSNYTTFFNYDENLNQVRVRVETENGIQTIVESEFGGIKVPKSE